MKVYDLGDLITMEPVLSIPVQTNVGLLDVGFHKAFEQGGLLTWTIDTNTAEHNMIDNTWRRITILSGGTKTKVVVFNQDAIISSSRYPDRGDVSQIIALAEYFELTYRAGLCSRNELNVVPPSALSLIAL